MPAKSFRPAITSARSPEGSGVFVDTCLAQSRTTDSVRAKYSNKWDGTYDLINRKLENYHKFIQLLIRIYL